MIARPNPNKTFWSARDEHTEFKDPTVQLQCFLRVTIVLRSYLIIIEAAEYFRCAVDDCRQEVGLLICAVQRTSFDLIAIE